jgi:cytochrome b561
VAVIIMFNFLALILDDFLKGQIRSFEVFGIFTASTLIENKQVVANIIKKIHGISVYIFITVL